MRKYLSVLALSALLVGAGAPGAFADPESENCTKDRGKITCTEVVTPGNSPETKGGRISKDVDEGQGTVKNENPKTKEFNDGCSSSPNDKGKAAECPA